METRQAFYKGGNLKTIRHIKGRSESRIEKYRLLDFFWLPAFLARPLEDGGAGMGVVGSLGWIVPVQIGAYLGYLTFGFIADRIGRRTTFVLFMVSAAVLVPVYGQMARSPMVLMLLGPLLGYFGFGYFSLFGGFVAASRCERRSRPSTQGRLNRG